MNNNFIEDLNQLRDRQAAIVSEIEKIRTDASRRESQDLFHIQVDALKVLDEIDEIRRRCEDNSHTDDRKGKSDAPEQADNF